VLRGACLYFLFTKNRLSSPPFSFTNENHLGGGGGGGGWWPKRCVWPAKSRGVTTNNAGCLTWCIRANGNPYLCHHSYNRGTERNTVPTSPSLASQPTAPPANMADERNCNLHLRFLVRPTHSLTCAPQKSITLNQIRKTCWCLYNGYLTQNDVINGTRKKKAAHTHTHTHKDMTHFPERRSHLHSQVATACHLRLTTCFSLSRLTHSGNLAQGDALAPRSDFHVTFSFYNKLFIKCDGKSTTWLTVYV